MHRRAVVEWKLDAGVRWGGARSVDPAQGVGAEGMKVGSVRRYVFIVLLAALASPAAAQESINYASIGGRVVDQSGAVVPGAAVTARQTQTNITAAASTDQDGRFRFPYLRVGPYEV